VMLVPTILTNTVGIDTIEVRALACRELQAAESPKRTRHLEVSLPAGCAYTAGDHLGVCPKNDEEQVEKLARRLGAVLDGLFMVPKSMNVGAVPKGVVLQVRNVLTSLVDIAGLPTVALLDLLLAKAGDTAEQSRLREIRELLAAPGGADSPLRAAIRAGGYDVLRLLEEFPSCSLNIFEFLQAAQPLRPRYYSTSSSPRIHGDGVAHVAVGLDPTPVPGMPGREFRGMSSHYVHSLREGGRLNVIRSTGLDYIYRDEIERFTAEGVLDHLHVVTSREQPGRREYVQDRIREHGALVWRLLATGAYVYVCGSQPMRDGVHAAFVDVVAEHGSLPREHAEGYLLELETIDNRYRPDLWG
jgi:sulfite reductase alpha subunit-like flavoprotein